MTQRIYWVPNTTCPFGCLHCHNDSLPRGGGTTLSLLDTMVAHLPDAGSCYHAEEILIGGGEGLAAGTNVAHLVSQLRARFPKASRGTVAEKRAAGCLVIAVQTAGPPLADAYGNVLLERLEPWLALGVDYFHVASGDMFHRSRNPRYPWDALEASIQACSDATGVEFMVYGKDIGRLVPSGRVLDNLDELMAQGARLLTEEGYCAGGWETASHFLTGTDSAYPECSEVVIDPQGWVHPCCWYLLSPGLFDLGGVMFDEGMAGLASGPYCRALDCGDTSEIARLAGVTAAHAQSIRDDVGDCGLCRIVAGMLAQREDYRWLKAPALSERERAFYRQRLRSDLP